jgi:hypothetical protein
MATENLKSTQITALDANPVTNGGNTAGEGGPAQLFVVDANGVTGTTAVTGGTYQMCRIPSTAKVKDIKIQVDATVTTFAADIGVYYSTSHRDGTKQSNVADVVSGTTGPTAVNSTTGSQLFGTAVDLKTAGAGLTSYINESTSYTAAKRTQPIWQAAGLSSDPGGFFDVTLTLTSTNSGAPVPYMLVEYTM